MAATIALKEQTKNRMNFETGYLFCHVETKSSNVCSGIFCFSDLFGMTSIAPRTVGADSVSARGALPLLQTSRVAGEHWPLRRCRCDALCSRKMYAVQIHLSRAQKHFLHFFPALHRPKVTVFASTTSVLLLQSARDAL